jgi:A/G-specific adenine glycosylase
MLQQTTVEAVKPYFARFTTQWPDIEALASAEDQALMAAWAGLGYYARARNLLACARLVAARHGGRFPQSEAALRALPGIGAYTAAAIAAIAFNQPALVVDGNVERVITRLFAIATPLPQAGAAIRTALASIAPQDRPGDFAQGMMDLGATICTPRNPACMLCPWQGGCAATLTGQATAYPVKPAKRTRPVRHGTAFLVLDSRDRLLLRSRPPRGLLAGMAEIPSSAWGDAVPEAGALAEAPVAARYRLLAQPVIHVFTHFELRMRIALARVAADQPLPPDCRWVAQNALAFEPLPTLMKKLIAAGLASLQAA